MKTRPLGIPGLFVLLAVCVMPAAAQSDRGAITGKVKDPAGAVVTTAKVTAINVETNEAREVTSTDEGTFTIPQLQAAAYRLKAEAPGFKTSVIEDIKVAVQVVTSVDLTLQVGEVSDTVTVSSQDVNIITTDTPVQQLNVTEKQMRELPLQIGGETAGRSPLAFIFLDSSINAGGGANDQNAAARARGTLGNNFRINGGQGLGTEILIDGAGTRRAENGTFFTEVAPGPNAWFWFFGKQLGIARSTDISFAAKVTRGLKTVSTTRGSGWVYSFGRKVC